LCFKKEKKTKKYASKGVHKIHTNLSLFGIAFAAIYRAIAPGLERNFARFSAGSTNGIVHLTLRSAVILTGIAAGFASLGLIGKSFFFEEILLTCSEHKFLTAVFAHKGFVLMDQL
jgi:hypothetical protein